MFRTLILCTAAMMAAEPLLAADISGPWETHLDDGAGQPNYSVGTTIVDAGQTTGTYSDPDPATVTISVNGLQVTLTQTFTGGASNGYINTLTGGIEGNGSDIVMRGGFTDNGTITDGSWFMHRPFTGHSSWVECIAPGDGPSPYNENITALHQTSGFLFARARPSGPTVSPIQLRRLNAGIWSDIALDGQLSYQLRSGTTIAGRLVTLDMASDGAIVITGLFTSVSGVPAKNIAVYREGSWRALGSGLSYANLWFEEANYPPMRWARFMADGSILVQVESSTVQSDTTSFSSFARWDGSAWRNDWELPRVPGVEIVRKINHDAQGTWWCLRPNTEVQSGYPAQLARRSANDTAWTMIPQPAGESGDSIRSFDVAPNGTVYVLYGEFVGSPTAENDAGKPRLYRYANGVYETIFSQNAALGTVREVTVDPTGRPLLTSGYADQLIWNNDIGYAFGAIVLDQGAWKPALRYGLASAQIAALQFDRSGTQALGVIGGRAFAAIADISDGTPPDTTPPTLGTRTLQLRGTVDGSPTSLTVNGIATAIQPDGSWSSPVTIQTGTTVVVPVTVTNAAGSSTRTITISTSPTAAAGNN